MKPQKAVLKETKNIAVGTFFLVAVMVGVFAAIGRFDLTVLLGGLYTGAVSVGNFFILGLTVQNAVSGIQSEDPDQVKRSRAKVQLSYSVRMLAVFGLMVFGLIVLKLNPVATLLPLLFPRVTISVVQAKNAVSAGKKSDAKGSE